MISKQRMIIVSIVGLLLATCGTLYIVYVDAIFKCTLKWLTTLRPNSIVTGLWQKPSLKVTMDIYLFNWTNPDDFYNPEIKPRFTEVGPYHFIEKSEKIDLMWHNENATVSYKRRAHFYKDEEKSSGKMDERIVAPNLLSLTLYNKARKWHDFSRSLMEVGLKMSGNGLTLEKTVDQWLFTGFDTTLLRLKKIMPKNIVPELELPYEKIGYAYPRNDTAEIYGHHNIYTGADDFSKLGQIARWRYTNDSVAYPQCGKLRGSSGEFHPVPLSKDKPITYFVADMCRPLDLDYTNSVEVEGIQGYRYESSRHNVANGTENPANSCYCPAGKCVDVPSGLMNVSKCWYNAPVFMSFPHYYNADPFYVNQVDGIQPDKERHSFSVVLEPETGFILDLKARVMLTLLVEPIEYSSLFRKARRTFFPLVWVDYRTQISPELAFYLKLFTMSNSIIPGLLLIAIGLVLVCWYPCKLYWQPRYMRTIEITSMEKRVQSLSREQDKDKGFAEASPLIIGLEYVAIPPQQQQQQQEEKRVSETCSKDTESISDRSQSGNNVPC